MTAAPAPSAPLAFAGRMIAGKFKVLGPIGEGGMGIVVAADLVGTGQPVALKILRPEMLDEREVVRRFLDEAQTSIRIQHPNVIRVFEGGVTEDGLPYIAMERLDGTALSTFLRSGSRLPIAAILPIMQGLLAGLAAAHAAGVVHRDLKPENVFLKNAPTAPGGYEVKLLDFGIAKVMDAAGGMGGRTKTGMLLGTPAYMSPEQLRNSKEADARTDLWAAGVIFYELLNGRHPFPAPTEMARLPLILGSPPDRLDDVARPFAAILERALAKDKAMRYGSAQEMAAALAQAPSSAIRPVTAPMSSTPMPQHSYQPAAFTPTALDAHVPADALQRMSALPESGPGGTLTSPAPRGPTLASGAVAARPEPAPQVVMVPPTPRSEPERRGGVAPALVLAFVGMALLIGFLIGLLVGRSL